MFLNFLSSNISNRNSIQEIKEINLKDSILVQEARIFVEEEEAEMVEVADPSLPLSTCQACGKLVMLQSHAGIDMI